MECFSGDKTAQNSKTEGGIEKKRHENVKLKEEDLPGAIQPREKPEECTVKQLQRWLLCVELKQPERKRSSDKGKYARTGKFLKLFVHKKHMSTTCMSRDNSRWLLDLFPLTIPKMKWILRNFLLAF